MEKIAVCVQDDNKNVSPKETIDAINKAGFKDVFVQYYHRKNLEFDELEQIDYCKSLGLNIIFCHLGYDSINEIWIEGDYGEQVTDGYIKDLEIMKNKGIDMVVMHLTTHVEVPMYNELGLDRIRRIIKRAEELDMKVAFENTRKKDYLEYVLTNIKSDNIGVCFDAGHNHLYFNNTFNFEFFKNKIFAVHLHDNNQTVDQHLLPFDGTLDWDYVMKNLREVNYNGPMTLELCYRKEYLKQSVEEFYEEGFSRGKKLEEIFEKYK